ADLFQLQGAFQRHRVEVLPAQVEAVVDTEVTLGDPLYLVVALQRTADGVGNAAQVVNHVGALDARQVPHPAKVEGEHGQDRDLRGERLGAGNADLGSGVQVDSAVGLAGDGAADDVAQGQRRVALAFRFAQGGQGVGRLARLRDGDNDRVAVHRR